MSNIPAWATITLKISCASRTAKSWCRVSWAFCSSRVDNRLEDIKLYGGSRLKYMVVDALFRYLTKMERVMLDTLAPYPQFKAPATYEHLKSLVDGVIGHGSKMGEGWLLTAEMLELVESGYPNIVCTQPFGCLPNHIVGKGMVRKGSPDRPARKHRANRL